MNKTKRELPNSMSIRVTHTENNERAYILSNTFKNKKLRITPKLFDSFISALEKLESERDPTEEEILSIITKEMFIETSLDYEKEENARIWAARGWQRSMEYFYSTRRSGFSDSFVDYRKEQIAAVSEYRDKSIVPLPSKVETNLVEMLQPSEPELIEFGEVLLNRKCSERPKRGVSDFQKLSSILYFSTIKFCNTWRPDPNDCERIYRSLGSCFDFYIVNYNIDNLEEGVYKYHPDINKLESTELSIEREDVYELLIGHDAPLVASFSILMVVNFDRTMWRYRHDRALRNIYVEAGRVCQYCLLALTAYKLLTHITPASMDDQSSKLLGLDKTKQQLIYSISAG